jgi:iron-sulfur cluster repair protein YtfE (RIC family)
MTQIGDAIRAHHAEILATLTRHVRALTEGAPDADPRGFARFLEGELMSHARGEEDYLYPAVAPLVAEAGQATATMSIDHEHIARYVEEINGLAAGMDAAGGSPQDPERLARLALQLEAVLRLHLEKEETVYLPLFESGLPADEQRRVLDGMHEGEVGDA